VIDMKNALLIAAVLAASVSTANATVNNCARTLSRHDILAGCKDGPDWSHDGSRCSHNYCSDRGLVSDYHGP
jgi:hypothetical protein